MPAWEANRHTASYEILDRLKILTRNGHTKRLNSFTKYTRTLRTRLNFYFFQWFYHLPIHKVLLPSWVTTHPCKHTFALQKLSWLWCSHLTGQVFYPIGQQFDLDFGIQVFERLSVWIFVRLATFLVNRTKKTNFQPAENSSGAMWPMHIAGYQNPFACLACRK